MSENQNSKYVVRFSDLTISMEDKIVISNLHADFLANRCTILTGPGGSGKTTLFDGIVRKGTWPAIESGYIDVTTSSIAYMVQDLPFDMARTPADYFYALGLTYKEEISKCWGTHFIFAEELKRLEFQEFRAIHIKYHKIIHLTLVLAVGDFDLLLLDEPEVGVDENLIYLVDKILGIKRTKSVLINTHHVAFAEAVGDFFLLLIHGKPIEFNNKEKFFSSESSEVQYLLRMGC